MDGRTEHPTARALRRAPSPMAPARLRRRQWQGLLVAAAIAAGAAAPTMLAGCATGNVAGGASPQAQLVISRRVWALFQQYLGEGMPGAFAVSRDGQRANYVYCLGSEAATAARPCQFAMISQQALIYCGDDCIIFAEGTSINVPYRVE